MRLSLLPYAIGLVALFALVWLVNAAGPLPTAKSSAAYAVWCWLPNGDLVYNDEVAAEPDVVQGVLLFTDAQLDRQIALMNAICMWKPLVTATATTGADNMPRFRMPSLPPSGWPSTSFVP